MNDLHPYWLLGAAFAAALVPVLLGICTSYLKISIVLTMLRSALGTQQAPGALAVAALSLSLTACVMAPVMKESFAAAETVQEQMLASKPGLSAIKAAYPLLEPWRRFMQEQTGAHEAAAVAAMRGTAKDAAGSLPLEVLLPAFVLSELKEAFAMGFVLLLPFLVIDLIAANILAGMGMYMMSPVMIALPLKLLVFVACDGWLLLSEGLVHSYGL